MKNEISVEKINLFWTGGWDSTFRLLLIVLEEQRIVQPYYLIDPNRKSLRLEIRAMREIKNLLFKEYPQTKSLIRPTKFYEIGDIAYDEEISEAYKTYTQTIHLAFQYHWMSRFCKQFNICDMEIGAENSPTALVLSQFLERIGTSRKFKIAETVKGTPFYILFKNMKFPIYGYTRHEMEEKASSSGWLKFLYMTWFCHYPVKERYPCGSCEPCDQVIRKGYPKRVPLHRRIDRALGLYKIKKAAGKIVRRVNSNLHK
ncbi:MAG: hypothetical protein MUO40_02875 [Anaerolineaceae bacterium]|nr:hypothetical protein [Anaerolineaceae bacterium]